MEQFLIGKLGPEQGGKLAALTAQRLEVLRSQVHKPSKQQEKVLKNTLLPRIALYQVLQEQGFAQPDAYALLEQNMVECCAPPMRKNYEKLDRLPFAFGAFRFGFTRIVASSDLWQADIDNTQKNSFTVTMRKCFWHDTFTEYGCPELCGQACHCDDLTYSDLHHIGYHRTQTLGTGGSCCDFRFEKIHR